MNRKSIVSCYAGNGMEAAGDMSECCKLFSTNTTSKLLHTTSRAG